MKNAMKKLFSLMLVAVLLVGVLPFAASADGVPYYQVVLSSDNTQIACEGLEEGKSYSIASFIDSGYVYDFGQHKHADGSINELGDPFQVVAGDVIVIAVKPAPADPCAGGHTPGAAANCTAAQTCTVCGETLEAAKGHTAGAAATCTTAQTCTVCGTVIVNALNHNVVNGDCTRCDYTENTQPTPCPTEHCALNEGHEGEHKCSCGKYLQKGSTHEKSCYYYEASANTYTLTVWANLVTGKTRTETIKLDVITGLPANAKIYNVISDNRGRLESKFPTDFKYGWSGNVYHEKAAKTVIDMNSHMTVEDIREVYINLYTSEKLVVARVHTSKNYEIARTVEIRGYKIGETVTSSAVLSAVKKNFNVSNMKMYTPSQWERVVSGKSATTISNHVVTEGDNIIDVYITGSSISSSSSSSKADSTNPKTGDEIYMSVAVLGLSASALAVMFYLNKKRAY